MASTPNVTANTASDQDRIMQEHHSYENSLPKQQRASVWSATTLWSIVILFTVIMITLIIGGAIYLLR